MKIIFIFLTSLIFLTSCSHSGKKVTNATEVSPTYKRTPEVSQRVWFAPFVDEDGNQHEVSFVNVVIKESKWQAEDETAY